MSRWSCGLFPCATNCLKEAWSRIISCACHRSLTQRMVPFWCSLCTVPTVSQDWIWLFSITEECLREKQNLSLLLFLFLRYGIILRPTVLFLKRQKRVFSLIIHPTQPLRKPRKKMMKYTNISVRSCEKSCRSSLISFIASTGVWIRRPFRFFVKR